MLELCACGDDCPGAASDGLGGCACVCRGCIACDPGVMGLRDCLRTIPCNIPHQTPYPCQPYPSLLHHTQHIPTPRQTSTGTACRTPTTTTQNYAPPTNDATTPQSHYPQNDRHTLNPPPTAPTTTPTSPPDHTPHPQSPHAPNHTEPIPHPKPQTPRAHPRHPPPSLVPLTGSPASPPRCVACAL